MCARSPSSSDDVGAREHLVRQIRGERLLSRDAPGEPKPPEEAASSSSGSRRKAGSTAGGASGSALRIRTEPVLFGWSRTTPIVTPCSVGSFEALLLERHRGEDELDVRRRQVGARPHERERLADVRRERAAAEERASGACSSSESADVSVSTPVRVRTTRPLAMWSRRPSPTPGSSWTTGTPASPEHAARPDPGELQDARRADRAGAEDDASARGDLLLVAVHANLDAHRARVRLEHDPGDERARLDGQVRAPHRRPEVAVEDAEALATPLRHVARRRHLRCRGR